MGEYGLSFREACKIPNALVGPLWQSRERRKSRDSLRLMDDMFSFQGLHSPVEVEGETKKPEKKIKPVHWLAHKKRRFDEGFPRKRKPWSPEREKRAIDAFWGSAGGDGITLELNLGADDG